MTHARVTLRITGRVQGVWYRASTKAEADRLGVYGWVANDPDGSVVAVAEGPRSAVEALVAWCQNGPSEARVAAVDTDWGEASGEFEGFAIRRLS